jgi:hypothetical protein
MAGRGFPPKSPDRRAGKQKDHTAQTVLRSESVEPPALPERYAEIPEVAQWWETWVFSPQAEVFGSTDWQFLLDTLPLVAAYYEGNLKVAAELRLRMASYGATPADRARLRMTFAQADQADAKRPADGSANARSRYGNLRVVSQSSKSS